MRYPSDRLQAEKVAWTIATLGRRIEARFPNRALALLADDLATVAQDASTIVERSAGKVRWLRRGSWAVAAAIVAVMLVLLGAALGEVGQMEAAEWLGLAESAVNDVVFAGVAIWFVLNWPQRVVRSDVLELLQRLRSMAHVVDMHQLTKDPDRLREDYEPTAASEVDTMTRSEMVKYLDYCSELLSLVAKVAATCGEISDDDVVLDTVSDIERLTGELSQTIWQKISLLC